MKKHEKILEKLELDKKLLIQFCNINNIDINSNEFVGGKLNTLNEIIQYIKKL